MGNRHAGWAAALTFVAGGAFAAAGAGAMTGEIERTGGTGRAAQAGDASEESGARLERKLADILRHALEPASELRLTPLPESEIASYLAFQGAPHLPVGIREPVVRIGEDRLFAEAVIDLDAIRESRERTRFDLVRYLAGQLVVTASGRVRSANGMAQVDVETVTVGGIAVPAQVLQEMVRYFTRTPDRPAGTRVDEPIPLPYGIRELRLSPGLAVIVQ
jgi:hypothetical protein